MKPLKRALKALILTLLAYLIQVCVMRYLAVRGVTGSAVFAVLSVLIVSCGKKYAFCASVLIGMMMEAMLGNVPALYVLSYPVIAMFAAQYFADRSDRKREQLRLRVETRHIRISQGSGTDHWWSRLLDYYREDDLPPFVRIPLCAGVMDFLMNTVLAVYMYLIGEDLGLVHVGRLLVSVLYTMALAFVLMVPLRYVLGMYKKRTPRADMA